MAKDASLRILWDGAPLPASAVELHTHGAVVFAAPPGAGANHSFALEVAGKRTAFGAFGGGDRPRAPDCGPACNGGLVGDAFGFLGLIVARTIPRPAEFLFYQPCRRAIGSVTTPRNQAPDPVV